MSYNIYQVIDYSTGEVRTYTPDLAPLVAEIVNAETRAAEAARLTTIRERLAGLLPVTTARLESGDSLVVRLFPGTKPLP